MSGEYFKYLVTGGYVVLVYMLSWIGMRRTRDIKGFSIGNKDMSPYLVGITLAASIASTSTFVINPGFIYAHGLSAYLHYGLAGSAGTVTAFLILSRGFLRIGESFQALTLPDWIYHRYQNRGFSQYFAFINLLSITFVVLILVGCSLIMTSLFPVDQQTALVLILLFVFSYVLMGGTYAHAYTNTLQGIIMLVVAVMIFVEGVGYFQGGFMPALASVGENYASIYNPDSELYYSFFSVFASGFIITFALMLQPHILTKVLYLRSEADLNKFIGTTVVVGFLFTLILFVGFFARVSGLEATAQDAVVVEYLSAELAGSPFSDLLLTFVMLTLLAAGMSTLDGILVALSAMVVNDIVKPLSKSPRNGLLWSRWVLVGVGVIGLVLAWNSPPLIGLFAQKGVYGLAAASLVPMLFGVLVRGALPLWLVFGASLIGLLGHFILHLVLGIENPAVSASYAILLSLAYGFIGLAWLRLPKKP
ncbi:MAG: sodium:solute symporter [SAR86 cluster bacterium]|uniref:Sodium:solute symporter n=1 Tax=SAR86 cluster bacterium TaxID=2030880 RepID=A0A2A4MQ03_9GAMM|nr:MAG: sodium:solute symporter [SAR86 cluster bacterium]